MRGIGVRDGLLESGAALGRTVLVAFDSIQRLLGSIENELRWVVAKKALAHVHNGLLGGGSCGFINDGPWFKSAKYLLPMLSLPHQTSCRWPATRAAGFILVVMTAVDR